MQVLELVVNSLILQINFNSGQVNPIYRTPSSLSTDWLIHKRFQIGYLVLDELDTTYKAW